jgi:hypothetical protein
METKKLYSLFGLPLIAFNMSVMALEDVKVYPGALCQSETNTQSIVRNLKGMMVNTGTDPQTWICPIVRDRPDSIEDATIVVRDRNAVEGDPNADVSCTLFSRTPTGQLVASEAQGSTGTGIVALKYGVGDPNIDSNPGDGHYYFRCTIPGTFEGRGSGVVSYRVKENANED